MLKVFLDNLAVDLGANLCIGVFPPAEIQVVVLMAFKDCGVVEMLAMVAIGTWGNGSSRSSSEVPKFLGASPLPLSSIFHVSLSFLRSSPPPLLALDEDMVT